MTSHFSTHIFFKRKIMFLLFLILHYCLLTQSLDTSLFTIKRMSTAPHLDVTTTKIQKKSMLSCVFHCHLLDVKSFYYIESNVTCVCGSADDVDIGENNNNNGGIIYGIRTEKVTITYNYPKINIIGAGWSSGGTCGFRSGLWHNVNIREQEMNLLGST